jgi:hypothetical protein
MQSSYRAPLLYFGSVFIVAKEKFEREDLFESFE